MPSKGVNYYFYVNGANASIQANQYDNGSSTPAFSRTFTSNPAFQTGNVQINYVFSFTSLYGSFNWNTTTTPPVAGNVSINPLTGNVESGNLQTMMNTPSVAGPNFAVSYGFYDSGPGFGDLTNQDQIYAYLTPPMSGWMGQLAAQNPKVKSAPFSLFALPGAHDAGTFDLTTVNALLANGTLAGSLFGLAGLAIGSITASQSALAITNLAVTQKDNITMMLNLGCRYFDFRPGYSVAPLNSVATGIYHQHTVIPGYPFLSFLTDVLNWLNHNPTEIVVAGVNSQGFVQPSMTPSADTLGGILTQAQQATRSNVVIGTASDLGTSYGDLIAANKRLFFLNQIGDWYPATKYDSYSDSAYATTTPQPILNALAGMTNPPAGSNYTVLQLQGTATATGKAVIISSAASQSNASSPLMSTKAMFDAQTYPWLVSNVGSKVATQPQLVVFLNDFVDNALAQTAMTVTAQRIGS